MLSVNVNSNACYCNNPHLDYKVQLSCRSTTATQFSKTLPIVGLGNTTLPFIHSNYHPEQQCEYLIIWTQSTLAGIPGSPLYELVRPLTRQTSANGGSSSTFTVTVTAGDLFQCNKRLVSSNVSMLSKFVLNS